MMTDASTPTTADRPSTRERRSSILSLGGRRSTQNGTPTNATSDRGRTADTSSAQPSPIANTNNGADMSKQVQDVLSSEIGIATLLNRLKQSVSSAKEFAIFLKKRSSLEAEQANGLQRLSRATTDSLKRTDHLGGSFGYASDQIMNIHERMADNGMQFAHSLHAMSDDLMEMAAQAERSRKSWKQNGLAAEQRLVDVDNQMRKAQHKYNTLAEDYDRARTGDPSRQGKFGLKGRQTEDDIYRKLQAADQDYQNKVQITKQERADLLSRNRPEAIQALQDTIKECDSALLMQMQKFASLNEKLLLSNGMSISPIKDQKGAHPDARSLREIVLGIDGQHDFDRYVGANHGRIPPQTGEPKYERHPVLNTPTSSGPPPMSGGISGGGFSGPSNFNAPPGPPPQHQQFAAGPPGHMRQDSRQNSLQSSSPAVQSPYGPMSAGSNGPGGPGSFASPTGPGIQPGYGGPREPGAMNVSSPLGLGGPSGVGASDNSPSGPNFPNAPLPVMAGAQRPASRDQPQHERHFSAANAPGPHNGQATTDRWHSTGPGASQQVPPNSRFNHASNSSVSQQAPQLGALPFQSSQPNADYSNPQNQQQNPQQPPYSQTQQQQQQQQQQPPPQHQQPSQQPPFQHQQQQSFSQSSPRQAQQQQFQSHSDKQVPYNNDIAQAGMMASALNRAFAPQQVAPPTRPVFGVPLQQLYERDGLAVPMVVYQCIQAVDLYGLTMEGIYRLSGSANHVNRLKGMFDTDSSQTSLDFRNPENFFHDVNSVAGLLKTFFRDLPDPLLTKENYSGFIEAAKHEDGTVRRDSLHAIINSLPDPHYATLRAVALHLYRVIENSQSNRMNCQNLAIVFGPTLMGGNSSASASIADAGWQVKVVETILENTYQIFDDD